MTCLQSLVNPLLRPLFMRPSIIHQSLSFKSHPIGSPLFPQQSASSQRSLDILSIFVSPTSSHTIVNRTVRQWALFSNNAVITNPNHISLEKGGQHTQDIVNKAEDIFHLVHVQRDRLKILNNIYNRCYFG